MKKIPVRKGARNEMKKKKVPEIKAHVTFICGGS
jgi:hypothetical protein